MRIALTGQSWQLQSLSLLTPPHEPSPHNVKRAYSPLKFVALALAGYPAGAFAQAPDVASTACRENLPSATIEGICRAELLRMGALIRQLNSKIIAESADPSSSNGNDLAEAISTRQRASASLKKTFDILGARRRSEDMRKLPDRIKEYGHEEIPKYYTWPDAAHPRSRPDAPDGGSGGPPKNLNHGGRVTLGQLNSSSGFTAIYNVTGQFTFRQAHPSNSHCVDGATYADSQWIGIGGEANSSHPWDSDTDLVQAGVATGGSCTNGVFSYFVMPFWEDYPFNAEQCLLVDCPQSSQQYPVSDGDVIAVQVSTMDPYGSNNISFTMQDLGPSATWSWTCSDSSTCANFSNPNLMAVWTGEAITERNFVSGISGPVYALPEPTSDTFLYSSVEYSFIADGNAYNITNTGINVGVLGETNLYCEAPNGAAQYCTAPLQDSLDPSSCEALSTSKVGDAGMTQSYTFKALPTPTCTLQ
jgi:hypothetical protein